jgi:hypothetical protein
LGKRTKVAACQSDMTQILVSSERESLKVIVDDSSVKNRRGEELGCGGRIVRRFVDVLDNAELQLNWKTAESSHGGRWTEFRLSYR